MKASHSASAQSDALGVIENNFGVTGKVE